ncbi:MAG TPA: rod shape-determining protein MreC [Gemmatimonadaceae bacterium]|nr:rod shape-determining protein MreC [Gemmatimonadaceae bacterium]
MATAARLGSRVDAGLLAGCVVLSLIAVALPDSNREPIASALRRTIVAPLVALEQGAERWRTAWVSSERRQLLTDSLALRASKVPALESENDQLRKLLGLGTRLQWGFVPAEALNSAVPTGDLVTSMTLTAGSSAGIQPYDPVVAPEGLVGTIRKADPSISIAILYTDADFRASAVTADGATFGIVYPHAGRAGGGDAYMLELHGVPTRVTLKPGTMIYTSGLGGTFPRGIAIGSVVQEIKTSEVWTRTYLIRPSVLPSRVTSVLVLTAQRVTQGTGDIWGAAVNADSASKRIAAAGDSIQRQAALLEEKARQAALDSVRRATIDSVRQSLGAPPLAADSAAAASGVRDSVRRPGLVPTPPRPVPRRDTIRLRRDSIRPDTTRTPRP